MTVYYRGPSAHITDDLLEVWSPEHRVYRIGALDSVYVVDGAGRGGGPLPILATAGTVAAAVALLARSVWVAAVVLAALFAAGAIALVATQGADPHPYELRGSYDGDEVLLFRCTDAQTFGQVRRALARSIERHAEREWRAPY